MKDFSKEMWWNGEYKIHLFFLIPGKSWISKKKTQKSSFFSMPNQLFWRSWKQWRVPRAEIDDGSMDFPEMVVFYCEKVWLVLKTFKKCPNPSCLVLGNIRSQASCFSFQGAFVLIWSSWWQDRHCIIVSLLRLGHFRIFGIFQRRNSDSIRFLRSACIEEADVGPISIHFVAILSFGKRSCHTLI